MATNNAINSTPAARQCFCAYLGSGSDISITSASTRLILDNVYTNNASLYNTSTGYFNASESSLWLLGYNICYAPNATATNVWSRILPSIKAVGLSGSTAESWGLTKRQSANFYGTSTYITYHNSFVMNWIAGTHSNAYLALDVNSGGPGPDYIKGSYTYFYGYRID